MAISPEQLVSFFRGHGLRSPAFFGSALCPGLLPHSDIDVLVEFEPGAKRGMLRTAREATAMAQGHTRGDLDRDRQLELSLIRLVEVIGEAAHRVPPRVQEEHPVIPWFLLVSMRNRLIHGYDAVDLDAL